MILSNYLSFYFFPAPFANIFDVMLDSDLASLYKLSTKMLNQAVRRNRERFSTEFMFKLNDEKFKNLRSQIVTSSEHDGRRYLSNAFIEQASRHILVEN